MKTLDLEKMTIEPVNGHVLLEFFKPKKTMYLPQDMTDREFQATVVTIGKGCEFDFELKEGDTVIFEKFADSAIDKIPYGKDGERKVTLIKDSLIMGVWR